MGGDCRTCGGSGNVDSLAEAQARASAFFEVGREQRARADALAEELRLSQFAREHLKQNLDAALLANHALAENIEKTLAIMNARVENDRKSFERDEERRERMATWIKNLEYGATRGYRVDGRDIIAGVAMLRTEGVLW
jgi:hypothetical protein